jgi:hypothetical protein
VSRLVRSLDPMAEARRRAGPSSWEAMSGAQRDQSVRIVEEEVSLVRTWRPPLARIDWAFLMQHAWSSARRDNEEHATETAQVAEGVLSFASLSDSVQRHHEHLPTADRLAPDGASTTAQTWLLHEMTRAAASGSLQKMQWVLGMCVFRS